MTKFVIFDLDGTLIDTVEGIKEASNHYLLVHNIPFVYSRSDIESFIGNGAPLLFKRMIKDYKYEEKDYLEFLTYYKDYQNRSIIYPHVVKTLKELSKKGYELYIFSNKPDELLQLLIKEFLSDINFKYIQGQDKRYPPKPDITLLNKIILNNIKEGKGYYVGDSYVDILTAQNASLTSIFVTYGYGDYNRAIELKPDYTINEFNKILEILK